MHALKESYGPWAVITGASSGIGAEFASQLAKEQLNLVLVARREQKLIELAQHLKEVYKVEIRVVTADLAQPDFLPLIQAVTDSLDIGMLVNCAGFSITGDFMDNDLQKELQMLYVNSRAPLILTHAFGKRMASRKRGGIILISSSVALSPVPYWTHYAATKAHNYFLGTGLAYEWRHSGVDVLTVCPGGTRTEFQEIAGIRDMGAMSAASVVTSALRNLGTKSLIIPGWHNRLLYGTIAKWIPARLKLRIFAGLVRKLRTQGR